jgi:alpha-1,2-mannosyltransferase
VTVAEPEPVGTALNVDKTALNRSRSAPDAVRASRTVLRRRVVILTALALGALTFDVLLAVRHGFFDLNVYHGAINYWMHDGGSLYDYLLPHNTYGFTYPPFAAITMLPMAITPWHIAIIISCLLCVATSYAVIKWFFEPVARREGWSVWFAMGIAFCAAAIFEPLRETFLFGQVNMLLVFLVAADFVLLMSRGSRFAGVLIGLATAIKLTPGIFIVYLLITKRWRAAFVASLSAALATLFAAAVAPQASLVFWTDAVWNTDRVGALAFISNQSLNGAVARLHDADPSTIGWIAAAFAAMAVWAVRSRRAAAAGDDLTGFALTGIIGCLVSPITWVHHLVWAGPALLLLLDNAMATQDRKRRRRLLIFMIVSYALLCSRLVWSFADWWYNPVTWFFSNAYVWVALALLVALPVRSRVRTESSRPDEPAADSGAMDRELVGLLDKERAPARPDRR